MSRSDLYNAVVSRVQPPNTLKRGTWLHATSQRPDRLVYEYVHTCVLLGLLHEARDGVYLPSQQEPEVHFSEPGRSCDVALSHGDRAVLRSVLLRLQPMREFLSWFMPEFEQPSDPSHFRTRASGLLWHHDRPPNGDRDHAVAFYRLDSERTFRLHGDTLASTWTHRRWARDVDYVSEMPVPNLGPPGTHVRTAALPVRSTLAQLLDRVSVVGAMDHVFPNSGVPTITQARYEICRAWGLSARDAEMLMSMAFREAPQVFYLERTSASVVGSHSVESGACIEVDGYLRSHMRVSRRERRR